MRKTIAQALFDKGFAEGVLQARRDVLLLQLRARFGSVSSAAEALISATTDMDLLSAWLIAFVTARKPCEVFAPLLRRRGRASQPAP